MENQRLLELERLISEERYNYIKAGAKFCSYQFIRTCLLDSYLAAFHIMFLKFPNCKDLFNSDKLFKNILALLNDRKYAQAKVVSMWQLKHVKIDHTCKEVDFYGNMKDHFPLFHKLVCAEMTSNQKIPNDSLIHKEILSNFNKFGYIKALGDPADPTLILLYCLTSEPLPCVKDKKKRIFEIQFFLLGKDEHMAMCFRFSTNEWLFYDNDPAKPSFQSFSFDTIKEYVICLAGYVNITQAQECKLGIPETGEGTGAQPFYSSESTSLLDTEQSVEDVEMEDLSSYSVPIPETGEGLGPQPFYQN
ncbi:uncharacterized protein LOC113529331 isoform X2 [Pangasianodon hypophthalmus]|uniref:uncharacterized protein LOC113529331 isoform X2 n=1 Tax=Pangasianodon hypophthalmus TaxID=310915 RepID=UPI002306F86A|nr:uncharacterized protein LOC113529331 isoform X2 [Pangasianodon hypophthalmus]